MKEHLRTAIWRDIIISLRKRRFNSADGDKEEKNMTVKECYEQMGADYEGVLGRLRSEVLIKKFAKKFLDDGSFRSLKDNLAQKNGEEAFRAAHTLKGVCHRTLDLIICIRQALILQRSSEEEILKAVKNFWQKWKSSTIIQ